VDFISRAGSLIDRGHRIVGILLVVMVLQFLWISAERTQNQKLQEQINYMNRTHSIYVVPNSQASVYKPASGKLLLSTFVDHITQSLMTYTPATFQMQYNSIKPFLSAKILEKSKYFYENEIKKSEIERVSSMFVIDRRSTELDEFKEIGQSTDQYGPKKYAITVKGKRHIIVGGQVLEAHEMHFKLQLQETSVSKVNPFGFMVTAIDFSKVKPDQYQ
jgi:type II secretory pathway pseudopilin PulG